MADDIYFQNAMSTITNAVPDSESPSFDPMRRKLHVEIDT
jgi:hypothetical protein